MSSHELYGVSNPQQLDCISIMLRLPTNKTSKLHTTDPCYGNIWRLCHCDYAEVNCRQRGKFATHFQIARSMAPCEQPCPEMFCEWWHCNFGHCFRPWTRRYINIFRHERLANTGNTHWNLLLAIFKVSFWRHPHINYPLYELHNRFSCSYLIISVMGFEW